MRAARLSTLPAAAGDTGGERATAPLRRVRVLVVEDNPADLELLETLLRFAGHEFAEVRDPASFVARLLEVQPDLVLMDLRLPGTSGWELVETAAELLTMPVVAVTGYPQWVLAGDPRSVLFRDVIAKPIEPTELLARLDGLLGEPASGR